MLPPPTAMATSTPRSATPLTALAMAAIRPGSAPYSRSPSRASPESLRRTRRNAGWPLREEACATGPLLLADSEAGEAPDHHVLAGGRGELGPELLDRPALVLVRVHVRLAQQHHLVEPLAHAPLGDPLLDLLRLAVGRRLLPEDPQLLGSHVVGHLVLRDVQVGGRRHVEGDFAGEGLELVVPGDEVGLAVDLDEHADLARRVDVARDDPLRRGPLAPAGGLGLPADPQDLDRLLDVATRLLERRLAVHHPRARAVAQGLHVLRRYGHSDLSSRRRARRCAAPGERPRPAPEWPARPASSRLRGPRGGRVPRLRVGPPPRAGRAPRPRAARAPRPPPARSGPAPPRPGTAPRAPGSRRPGPRSPAGTSGWRRRCPGSRSRPGRDRSCCRPGRSAVCRAGRPRAPRSPRSLGRSRRPRPGAAPCRGHNR